MTAIITRKQRNCSHVGKQYISHRELFKFFSFYNYFYFFFIESTVYRNNRYLIALKGLPCKYIYVNIL